MFAVVQFHHADIGLPSKLDTMLSWVIVTPNLHKVHHSEWQPETDSNYGSLFSFWDRLFRSRRMREDSVRGATEVGPRFTGGTKVPPRKEGLMHPASCIPLLPYCPAQRLSDSLSSPLKANESVISRPSRQRFIFTVSPGRITAILV